MAFDLFISGVSEAMSQPLPGLASQMKMSSMKRIHELVGSLPFQNGTPSSVLLLLYPWQHDVYTVLMQRPDYGGVHAGQISLPGGKQEHSDKDLLDTALRESYEEVAIDPGKVNILGSLSELYIPPSRFLVKPFVGYTLERPSFEKDPKEVKEIIELPLRELFQEESIQMMRHKVGMGVQIKAPAFVLNGYIIWGATAMILSEFRDVIKSLL